MARRLTHVIRRVTRSKPKKKAQSKKRGGYDVSWRATGYRLVPKTEQNKRRK